LRPIAGGTFRMGSDRHYPEESPVHEVVVGPFKVDVHPVTNDQFAVFVNGQAQPPSRPPCWPLVVL